MSSEHITQLDKKQIGRRIKQQRAYLNMDREELAESIHIATSHLVKIENGHTGMSLEVLCALSDKLNISTDYILKGDIQYDFNKDSDSIMRENIMRSISHCDAPQLKHIHEIMKAALSLMDGKL